MSSSLSYTFLFEDSSSSDDLDIDELLNNDDTEHRIPILAAKELQDKANLKRKHGSTISHICIPWNRALEHATLMQELHRGIEISAASC
jgi:hypothetical protein